MGSLWNARTRLLLYIAAALLVVNLGRQLYRWAAFADERDDLRRLGVELDGAALGVMRTQLLADSLRGAIQTLDSRLEAQRAALAALERAANGGGLPPQLYEEYRADLDEYNGSVAARNDGFDRWRAVVERNHLAVGNYNVLADSIRSIGVTIGEPYISIPSPAEVAVRHGLDTTSSFLGRRPPVND
jgi:hypothetical protein